VHFAPRRVVTLVSDVASRSSSGAADRVATRGFVAARPASSSFFSNDVPGGGAITNNAP